MGRHERHDDQAHQRAARSAAHSLIQLLPSLFACHCHFLPIQARDSLGASRYTLAFSNSLGQLLADPGLEVKLVEEVWVRMLLSLVPGAALYAWFVAALTTYISDSDAAARDYRTKMDSVNEYMRHNKLPLDTNKRIR